MENELYDGEYFIQKIKWTGLKAADPVEASRISMGGSYSKEALDILQKEGPKYQYGTGCLSDGILGMWMTSWARERIRWRAGHWAWRYSNVFTKARR
jgi:hypothetical protein